MMEPLEAFPKGGAHVRRLDFDVTQVRHKIRTHTIAGVIKSVHFGLTHKP